MRMKRTECINAQSECSVPSSARRTNGAGLFNPQSEIRNPKSKPVRLQPPANEALAAFLARRWGAPIRITRMIAEGARGNVRAAMGDLELWMG